MVNRKRSILLLFLILFLVSCANIGFVNDGYDILAVSKQAYDFNLSLAGDLYKEGKLTEEQKTKAIEIGKGYMIAHNGAVESLAKYKEGQGDKNAVMSAISEASKTLADLIKYVRSLL